MYGYKMTEKICKIFYGLSSLKQWNTFKTYSVYVLTIIYSCLCVKGIKKEGTRKNWTRLMG